MSVWGRRDQSVPALTPLVVPESVEERRVILTGTWSQSLGHVSKFHCSSGVKGIKGRTDKQERKELTWVGWRLSSKGNTDQW